MTATIFQQLEQLILDSESPYQKASSAPDETPTVPSILAALGTPTTSIAVLDSGTISTHCYTTRTTTDTPNPVPLDTPDTLFQACSISKPTAAVALLNLISTGQYPSLTLTTSISALLPPTVLETVTQISNPAVPRAVFDTITLRHLLSHTAGLSQSSFGGYPVASHALAPRLDQVVAGRGHAPAPAADSTLGKGVNTGPVKVVAPPGLKFMYSGGGTTLAQLVAEHVTGEPFETLMRRHCFDPLDMRRSCYRVEGRERERDASRAYFNGYSECDAPWHVLPEMAAGGLWTTPADLMKLVRGMQRAVVAGRAPDTSDDDNDVAILTSEVARDMLTRVTGSIGLGWFVTENAFGHGGSNHPGWRCFAVGYADLPWNNNHNTKEGGEKAVEVPPPENCGVAVMTNSAMGYAVVWKVMNAIAYLKGWPELPLFFGNVEEGVPFAVAADDLSVRTGWKGWAGEWHDGRDGGAAAVWTVAEDASGWPVAGIGIGIGAAGTAMRLKTAACPPRRFVGGRRSIDLVLVGCAIMLRLGWDGDRRVVDLWNHWDMTSTVLSRKGETL